MNSVSAQNSSFSSPKSVDMPNLTAKRGKNVGKSQFAKAEDDEEIKLFESTDDPTRALRLGHYDIRSTSTTRSYTPPVSRKS